MALDWPEGQVTTRPTEILKHERQIILLVQGAAEQEAQRLAGARCHDREDGRLLPRFRRSSCRSLPGGRLQNVMDDSAVPE